MRIHGFKSFLIVSAAALCLSIFLTAANAEDAEKDSSGDDHVAVVNKTKIPAEDLERKVDMIRARYAGSGAEISGEQLAQLKRTILDNIIDQEMLYQASREEGIEVDPDEIQQEIDQLMDQFENQEDFRKQMAEMNYSEEALEKEIRQNLAIRKLIDERFASEISVSDDDIKAYYEENQSEFEEPERVHARHILIRSGPDDDDETKEEAKEKLEEVREKLESGEEFSELARQYSEGPTAESGGDLGYFSRGEMVKRFDEAAFGLEAGEVSDIVETRFGYHLIKVEDKKEQGVQPLDDVKGSISENLEREKVMRELEPYLESLKEKYDVEKNLPEADQG
ncbi:MAG: peptidylprolyl isomerase [Desulfobacterales bacterium]